MASRTLTGRESGTVSAAEQRPLTICLIGGIYGKNGAYRATIRMTPETVLESGLKGRGHRVVTLGHRDTVDFGDVDIFHVHHLGLAALRIASHDSGAAFVYTSHDGPAMAGLPAGFSRRLAAQFVMSRADAVVALSEAESAFQRKTYSLDGAAHVVISNGIASDVYTYGRSNPAGQGRPWRLLCVAQLVKLKRVDLLVRALALLPADLELDLVYQTDPLKPELEKLAEEGGLKERVHFLGPKSPSELCGLYQSADLFVLPSAAESLPSVIVEAMLCGTPVVATDVGGIRGQLGGYGVLVQPGCMEELAAAIRRVLEHYGEFAEKSEAMSRYAQQRFSIETMVERHLELYRSLLEKKGSPRRNRLLLRPLNIAAKIGVSLLCKT